RLSEEYGLASREMSLVAVVKRTGDRPGELPETRVVPLGIPQDVSLKRYFGMQPDRAFLAMPPQPLAPGDAAGFNFRDILDGSEVLADIRSRRSAPPAPTPPRGPEDQLVELASRMEPDGGMPGKEMERRTGATVAALFAFMSHGNTVSAGPFRSHVQRLVAF